jgi:L-ascorbate metabolism protein UlaG (beta-lactamase superfamily)
MTERGYPSVISDPFVKKYQDVILRNEVSEIVTSSVMIDDPYLKKWQDLAGVEHTIGGPGEFEIGGVFITGIASHKNAGTKHMTPDNNIYTINLGDVIVCHFGECGIVPTQSQLEVLGRVNVLLIPVGIPDGLSPAMASEIVSMIEPDIIVPSHYALPDQTTRFKPVTPFLKLMGVDNPTIYPSLKVERSVSPVTTGVVLLETAR